MGASSWVGAAIGTCARLGLFVAVVSAFLIGSGETVAWLGTTTRVSVSTSGTQGNGDSLNAAISVEGRYVAFHSAATNLVLGDTNGWVDAFVRDRQTGTTERVSLSSSEVEGNDTSWYPAINADGRFVVFQSFASNLVSGDTNNVEDVFVRDRQAGTTTRVSLSSGGSQGNAGSWDAAISDDGRYVAFYSEATNLVAGDSNGADDVFVRDRDTDADGIFDEAGAVSTTRVSVDNGGSQGNGASSDAAISGDGRYVSFYSEAADLVSGDTNGYGDIFVRDRQAGTTARVSVDSAGTQANGGSYVPAISADGRYVAFHSAATNLVGGDTNSSLDVFVRDRLASSTERASVDSAGNEGNADSSRPAVSADGRYVAFQSEATNLSPGDTNGVEDTFIHDRQAGTTARVSVASGGGQAGDGSSSAAGVSPDGLYVVFHSGASNLVAGDTNGRQDIFVHDRLGTVGGIAELSEAARDSGRPEIDRTLLAGLAAAALAVLAAGAWYAGRRLRQG